MRLLDIWCSNLAQRFEGITEVAIICGFRTAQRNCCLLRGVPAELKCKHYDQQQRGQLDCSLELGTGAERSGQVAQVVERSPEKAGVGGSTPSLATIILRNFAAESRIFQPTIQPMILTELVP